jgi:hypothetical protein
MFIFKRLVLIDVKQTFLESQENDSNNHTSPVNKRKGFSGYVVLDFI